MDTTERAAMWTYIGVIVGFKIVTAIFILWYTHSFETIALLIALHVSWIVAAAVLLGVPGTLWYRLIRTRMRRNELMRQEFLDEPPPPAKATSERLRKLWGV